MTELIKNCFVCGSPLKDNLTVGAYPRAQEQAHPSCFSTAFPGKLRHFMARAEPIQVGLTGTALGSKQAEEE
jgi:hypothetical protein